MSAAAAVNAIPAAVWREVLKYLSSPEGVASAITEEAAAAALEELYRCHRVNMGTAPDPTWDWGMSITGQLGKLIGVQESVRNARLHRLSAPAPAPTPWLSRASVEAAADSVDAQRKRDRRAALEREEAEECRREHEKEEAAACRRARRRDLEEGRRLNDPNDPIAIAAERDRLESIKASVRRSKARDLERELEAAGIVAPSFGEMLGPGSEVRLAEYANKKAAYLAAKEASAAPKPAAPTAVAAAAPTYAPWVLRELAKLAPKPPREDQSQAEFEDASARVREMAERGRQRDEERAREAMEARRLVDEANARFAAESRAAAAAAAPAPAPAPSKWADWPHGISADGVPLPPPPPAPPAYVPRQRVDVDLTQSDDEEAIVVK
jgi:hypothetical protein